MQKKILSCLAVTTLYLMLGCNSGQKTNDTVENAEKANEQKAESTGNSEDQLKDDTEFAVKAADGGMLEVQLGKLALSKATSQESKTFAQHMIDDHTKANEELTALAAKKNITLPVALGEEKQKDYDRLSKLSGLDFDKEYTKYMVDDHQEDVKEFKEASEDAHDAEIKAFATKTVPTLESHLDMAKQAMEAVTKKH